MEIIVTVSSLRRLNRVLSMSDGIIMAGDFSERVSFSREELEDARNKAREASKKFYLAIDAVICEGVKSELYTYLDWVKELDPDGIYFNDFAVLKLSEEYGLKEKLIYDGGPLVTNTLDIQLLLDKGIDGAVLARELTLEEDLEIIRRHRKQLDMQIFGHLKMSTSKRRFLTNYFRYINKDADITGNELLTLKEENRMSESYPVVEDENGTRIYSDFILEAYEELPYLSRLLKRGIVEDRFIADGVLFDVLRDYSRVTEKNAPYLKEVFTGNHPDASLSTGYFYQKTTLEKNERED